MKNKRTENTFELLKFDFSEIAFSFLDHKIELPELEPIALTAFEFPMIELKLLDLKLDLIDFPEMEPIFFKLEPLDLEFPGIEKKEKRSRK